ncbi:MAG TPA: WD40 repeat domain-containing protein, partial [Thermoanaerobaculia bacterium]
GWVGSPRFSPRGDEIALIDHWGRLGDLGLVVVVDLAGHARTISEGWSSIHGLAWAPGGKEVWFTGTKSGGNRALYAAGRSGGLRLVYRQTGSLTIADVSSKGEVLLVDEDLRLGIVSRAPGEPAERDFSFLDFSAVRALSSDGKLVLFDEASEGGGDEGGIFLRKTDGSPPVRLGSGFSMAFSPDGKSVLAGTPRDLFELRQLPVGPGEVRAIAREKFAVAWGDWLPDGRLLVSGGEKGRGARLWVQNTSGGEAKPITAEGVHLIPYTNLVSPDGKFVAAAGRDGVVSLFPTMGGEPAAIRGLAAGEVPCSWDTTGKFLFVYRPGEFPAHVSRLEIETGARVPWKELMPADPAGVTFIRPPHFSGDGGAYAYSFSRVLHELYLVKDLR